MIVHSFKVSQFCYSKLEDTVEMRERCYLRRCTDQIRRRRRLCCFHNKSQKHLPGKQAFAHMFLQSLVCSCHLLSAAALMGLKA